MPKNSNSNPEEDGSIFKEGEFVLFKKDGKIQSGGFDVNSSLLRDGNSAMSTINSGQQGGGINVSDLFNNLAIPPMWFNMQSGGKIYQNVEIDEDTDVSDDIHDKLLELVTNSAKISKKTTRRERKSAKKNTRKK